MAMTPHVGAALQDVSVRVCTWMGLRPDADLLQVGRPRPNFVALCWAEGDVTWDANSGLAICSEGAKNAAEGRKSFPSGGSLLLCIFHTRHCI